MVVFGLATVGASTAAGTSPPQRVVINVKIAPAFPPVGEFVLTPTTPGRISRDSGTLRWEDRPSVDGMTDGQSFSRHRSMATFRGRHGTLVVAEDDRTVDAALGVEVMTGTWRVVRGTGLYRGVTGRGRNAGVFGLPPPLKGNRYPVRYEGYLSSS